MLTFDPYLEVPGGGVLIKGEFTNIVCKDPAETFPVLSRANLVMDGSKTFEIELKWKLEGSLVPLWLSALGGEWSVEAYAESIGPGPERMIASGTSNEILDPSRDTYTANLIVSPGTLPEGNPGPNGPSGKYKIMCSCFLNSTLGAPGFDISGFAEGPMILIENPR